MPRLLPSDALDGPPVRARWTAILTAALAITAWNTDWTAAWDTTRGLMPVQTDRHEWTAATLADAPRLDDTTGLTEGIDDPASAESAWLEADDLILELAWEQPLSLERIRVETYADTYGTGHRLAIAADSTTADGTNCLNARLTTLDGTTTLQTCSRTDRHPPLYEEEGTWLPDKLFVTQTANLQPAARTDLVDYLGLGLHLGVSEATGMWGPNWWTPMMGGQYHGCDDPNLYALLDDLHLRPEYAIHTEHKGDPDTVVRGPVRVSPDPGALYVPACVPVKDDWTADPRTGMVYATDPYVQPQPSALAAWTRYNAAKDEPGPLRTIAAVDLRSCDTETAHCTGDTQTEPQMGNAGPVADWIEEFLGTDH
jgi:hypothetical protein